MPSHIRPEAGGLEREESTAPLHSQNNQVGADNTTKTIRFRLLGDLALALSQLGCSAQVVLPTLGSAVLYVDHRDHGQARLGIGAIEYGQGWVYSWSGRWAPAHSLNEVAQHIAREVLA